MGLPSIRIALLALVLLPDAAALAQVTGVTENRAKIEAELEQIRTSHPVESTHRIGCPQVHAMEVNSRRGDALFFGKGGAAGGVSFAQERESTWPLQLDVDILGAIVDSKQGHLLLACADGLVRRYRRGSFGLLATYPEDAFWAEARVRDISLSPDGTRLVIAGDVHGAWVFDLEAGDELGTIAADAGGASAVAHLPDGTLLVGAADGRLLRVAADALDAPQNFGSIGARPILLAPLGTDRLAVVSEDGGVTLRRLTNGEVLETGRPLGEAVAKADSAMDPFGALRLLLAAPNGRAVLVDGASLAVLAEIPAGTGELTAVSIDPYGVFAVTAFRGGMLHRWNLQRLADEHSAGAEGIDRIRELLAEDKREKALALLRRLREPLEARRIAEFLAALPPPPEGWRVNDEDWEAKPAVRGHRSYTGPEEAWARMELTESLEADEARELAEALADPVETGHVQGVPALLRAPSGTGGSGSMVLMLPPGAPAAGESRQALRITTSGIDLAFFNSQLLNRLDLPQLLKLASVEPTPSTLPLDVLLVRARNAAAESQLGRAVAALDAAKRRLTGEH